MKIIAEPRWTQKSPGAERRPDQNGRSHRGALISGNEKRSLEYHP